jgi:hypothetical protein
LAVLPEIAVQAERSMAVAEGMPADGISAAVEKGTSARPAGSSWINPTFLSA